MRMHKSLQKQEDEMGINPTRSIEAASHLALRLKLFKIIVRQRGLFYKASTDPPLDAQGRQIDIRLYDTPFPECGKCFGRFNKAPARFWVAYPSLNNSVAPRYNQEGSWK